VVLSIGFLTNSGINRWIFPFLNARMYGVILRDVLSQLSNSGVFIYSYLQLLLFYCYYYLMLKEKNIWNWLIAFSILGIGLASYLLYNYYAVVPSTFCNISSGVNCNAVTKGTLSLFFGIPVAVWGLIGYAFILFASLTKRKKLAFGMATFGMLFCLRITILELFFVKIICPVCLACQFDMLFLFLLGLQLNYKLIKSSK